MELKATSQVSKLLLDQPPSGAIGSNVQVLEAVHESPGGRRGGAKLVLDELCVE